MGVGFGGEEGTERVTNWRRSKRIKGQEENDGRGGQTNGRKSKKEGVWGRGKGG